MTGTAAATTVSAGTGASACDAVLAHFAGPKANLRYANEATDRIRVLQQSLLSAEECGQACLASKVACGGFVLETTVEQEHKCHILHTQFNSRQAQGKRKFHGLYERVGCKEVVTEATTARDTTSQPASTQGRCTWQHPSPS